MEGGHLKSESAGEYCAHEDVVAPEDGVVEGGCDLPRRLALPVFSESRLGRVREAVRTLIMCVGSRWGRGGRVSGRGRCGR